MTKTIENLFIYGATYGPIIPLLFFIALLRRKKKVSVRKPEAVFYLLVLYSLAELFTNCFAFFNPSSDVIRTLYSCFTVVEYSLFATCFYLFIEKKSLKPIIITTIIGFAIFAIGYSLFVNYRIIDSIPIGIETILVICFSVYYLYEEMEKPSQVLIYNRFQFWIVSGIMIYLAGSFFIYIFASQVDSTTRNQYWIFSNAFTVLKYIFFIISVVVAGKTSKPSVQQKLYPYLN